MERRGKKGEGEQRVSVLLYKLLPQRWERLSKRCRGKLNLNSGTKLFPIDQENKHQLT